MPLSSYMQVWHSMEPLILPGNRLAGKANGAKLVGSKRFQPYYEYSD